MSNTSFRDFLSRTVNLKPEEKVAIAKGALNKLIEFFQYANIQDEHAIGFMLDLTKLFISADVKLAQDEYDFFVAVTDVDIEPQKFYDITNGGADQEFVNKMLDLIESLPNDAREAAVTYGIMVMACDETIDYAESELIQRLIATLE